MKIKFNLEYQTIFGEEIVLNVLGGGRRQARHSMVTSDGYHWTCELTWVPKTSKSIDYYYSVEHHGEVERHEWAVVPHRLDLTQSQAVRMVVYDHWINLPQTVISTARHLPTVWRAASLGR